MATLCTACQTRIALRGPTCVMVLNTVQVVRTSKDVMKTRTEILTHSSIEHNCFLPYQMNWAPVRHMLIEKTNINHL